MWASQVQDLGCAAGPEFKERGSAAVGDAGEGSGKRIWRAQAQCPGAGGGGGDKTAHPHGADAADRVGAADRTGLHVLLPDVVWKRGGKGVKAYGWALCILRGGGCHRCGGDHFDPGRPDRAGDDLQKTAGRAGGKDLWKDHQRKWTDLETTHKPYLQKWGGVPFDEKRKYNYIFCPDPIHDHCFDLCQYGVGKDDVCPDTDCKRCRCRDVFIVCAVW